MLSRLRRINIHAKRVLPFPGEAAGGDAGAAIVRLASSPTSRTAAVAAFAIGRSISFTIVWRKPLAASLIAKRRFISRICDVRIWQELRQGLAEAPKRSFAVSATLHGKGHYRRSRTRGVRPCLTGSSFGCSVASKRSRNQRWLGSCSYRRCQISMNSSSGTLIGSGTGNTARSVVSCRTESKRRPA
jgi:hypothetical protein